MTRAAAEQRLTEPGKDERGTRRSERGTTKRERHDDARETRRCERDTDEQQDLATGEAY